MTDPIIINPTMWSLEDNIIPLTISALTNTDPFTGTNATLTIQNAAVIDGHSLKRLRIVPSW